MTVPFFPAALLVLATGAARAPQDTEPPIIEDLAAAASNPAAAPVITAMLSDPGTGVGTAYVIYRAVGANTWEKAELKGGTGGLFIARLPDGLQKSGFDYYIEATDVAGNGPTRVGSADAPIRIDRAHEATIARIERQEAMLTPPPPAIHPAWMMLSLGVGVLAGAGAGAYALDLVGLGRRITSADERLADPAISDNTRAALLVNKKSLETASVQDTVIATVLGVVGAAGIVTGTTLVVIGSVE